MTRPRPRTNSPTSVDPSQASLLATVPEGIPLAVPNTPEAEYPTVVPLVTTPPLVSRLSVVRPGPVPL